VPNFTKMPTPPPKPQTSAVVGRKKGFKSKQIKPASSRKRPIEGMIFGEEVFLENVKKERSIVIGFYSFTKNNFRISKDRKFVIEYIPKAIGEEDYCLNLFYFPTPTVFDNEKDLEWHIPKDAEFIPTQINHHLTVKDIEDKVISLCRIELLEERKKRLEKIKEEDEIERLEREAKEAEEEKNESANSINEINASNSVSENNSENAESKEAPQVFVEERKEEIVNDNKVEENRGTTTPMFRKIS
jgi:hypothetical protein